MKCIEFYRPNARVVRVKDEEARMAVASGKARFVPKSAWKPAKIKAALAA